MRSASLRMAVTRDGWDGTRRGRANLLRFRPEDVLAFRLTANAEPAVAMNRLGNARDRAPERGPAARQRTSRSMQIVNRNEILDPLADTPHRSEDVANVLEGVVVKQA